MGPQRAGHRATMVTKRNHFEEDEDGDAQEVEDSTTAEQPEDDAVCAVPLRTLFAVMLGTLVSPSPPVLRQHLLPPPLYLHSCTFPCPALTVFRWRAGRFGGIVVPAVIHH